MNTDPSTGRVPARPRPGTAGKRRRRPAAVESDRARILQAAELVLCEQGAEAVTVEAVTARARVSPGAFHDAFADSEDCLLGVFDAAIERIGEDLCSVYEAPGSWVDRVRAALLMLLAFLEREPQLARFLILGSMAGAPAVVSRRRRVLSELTSALQRGAPAHDRLSTPAPVGAEALVAGVACVIHARVLDDPPLRLSELCGQLMAVMVLPFLGDQAARDELTRPLGTAGRDALDPPVESAGPQ